MTSLSVESDFATASPAEPAETAGPEDGVLSLTGRRWVQSVPHERLAAALVQRHRLSDAVARILAARGIESDAVPDFLAPSLRRALPDPSCLRDMDRGAARLAEAVETGESVAIFGDYDVDGASSAALLTRYLGALGAAPHVHIPDRQAEGYGPNAEALTALAAAGARLLICVDCGTTAHEPLAHAAGLGLDVIILDHHTAEPALPPAAAVINPNRLDEPGTLGHMAAVGIAFLFAVAVNRELRGRGFFARTGRAEPDLMRALDLVALGTICDVVPLLGVNRALVAQGLKTMARWGNPGLAALAHAAGLEGAPEAWHAGFLLGPRINAGGRVGRAGLGAELLSLDAPERAAALAAELDRLNDARKQIEAEVLEAALAQAEGRQSGSLLTVAGTGWHPGVIGIVAGRLKERFHRPAIVVGLDAERGVGVASGRSIRGVDLGAAIIAARQEGLLIKGGGHAMAGGFTVAAERLGDLTAFLEERIGQGLDAETLVPRLTIDASIAPGGARLDLAHSLARLGPFGAGHSEPRLAVRGAAISGARAVGGDGRHVALRFRDPSGRGPSIKAIAFRAMDSALGPALLAAEGRTLDLAGSLTVDRWQGVEQPQLRIEDAALP